MPGSPTRERNPAAKRARIAEAALELFEQQGFAETTIDQIADAAQVGRRTIFDHFASKQAILLDHLVVRREVLLQRFRERPSSEAPLVSLHAVLRELCEEGYDRRLLGQIRAALQSDLHIGLDAVGTEHFEKELVATLQGRGDPKASSLEVHALTNMAMGWFLTAVRIYFKDGRRSLVKCYDEVVATCVGATAAELA